jgi:hypothetical protein
MRQAQPGEQANAAADAPVVIADTGEFNLKSVRKQDGPAHSAPGGHIHGGEEVHAAKEQ